MSLLPPTKVEKLQAALHVKAKRSPDCRLKVVGRTGRPAYAAVDQHVRRRLRQWLYAKHQIRRGGTARFPDQYLYQTLGLTRLSVRTRNFS